MRKEYDWNPIYNLLMEIKDLYMKKYDRECYNLSTWIEKINIEKYNEIFELLQVNQHNEMALIRYGLQDMQEGLWTDKNSIYRECRSIVVDLKNEEIVLCPFRKFFNLNEVEENSIENITKKIKEARSIEITDKLDGSMQNARYYKDEFIMSGSMALDLNKSWRLSEGYNMLSENHKLMLKKHSNYTFIFEYISLKDAHVVLYDKEQEGLYLIGMRDVYTGEQLSYNQIKMYANTYKVAVTQIEKKSFNEVVNLTKQYKSHEKEGWVVNIDGHLIKVKCDDYVHLHRLLDKLSSVNVIIQNIADDKYDDMISKVPVNYRERVERIANVIIDYKEQCIKDINKYYEQAPKDNKKAFMIWVDTNCPMNISGYIKSKYLNKDFNVLKKNSTGYKKLKDLGIYESYSALFSDLEL